MHAPHTEDTEARAPTPPPFPEGWYCLGFSDELPRGGLWSRTLCGHELVVFRTRSGEVAAVDAYCPHLGAHFGHGGRVEGDCLRCPFHGFLFDTKGTCVSVPWGAKPPPTARARSWPVREVAGTVLVYHSPSGEAPAWEVPPLEPTGWGPPERRLFQLRGHPQETSENSVDVAHLSVVHGYSAVEELSPLVTEGPYLTTRYAMERRADVFGRPGGMVRAEFTIHVWGLGYSLVEVEIPKLGLATRNWVLATPTMAGQLDLRIALCGRRITDASRIHPLASLVPRRLLEKATTRAAMKGFAHDVQQDFIIWQHKAWLPRPALAQGDGPVGRYRQWARQFYVPRTQAAQASPVAAS